MDKRTEAIGLRSIVAVLLTLSLLSCVSTGYLRIQRELKMVSEVGSLNKASPYLKIHMLDGRLYILSSWKSNSADNTLSGTGELLDINRNLISIGEAVVPLTDVAVIETNVRGKSPLLTGFMTLVIPTVAVAIACLTNPKACFGSCPTFYGWDGETMALQAEGFSASVSRALEAADIDSLYRIKPSNQNLEIRLTNEAMETHVIRFANVLAVPRPERGRSFVTPKGEFWQAAEVYAPDECLAPEGSRRQAVQALDGLERFSRTDPQDLGAKETLELTFPDLPEDRYGLVLGFRQTLLTTYLYYQGLAYMGSTAGYWLAALERGDESAKKKVGGIGRALGGIEVLLPDETGQWQLAGEIRETGPIATDVQVVPLPSLRTGASKIRLRMTQGLWRLDYVALAKLATRTEAVSLPPAVVLRQGAVDEEARRLLMDPSDSLVTMPGDEYTLIYELPSDFSRYELFLESRGYYLEWMRDEWFQEESLAKTLQMFRDPTRFLKEMAPKFKKDESRAEEAFWRSKYVRH